MIQATQDIHTRDGYLVRVFAQGFTARAQGQRRGNAYAKTSEIKKLRAAMTNVLASEMKDYDCSKLMTSLANKDVN